MNITGSAFLHVPFCQLNDFCKLLSDFSMEYRTMHGKVLARLERKRHERERKKTKGRFIVSERETERERGQGQGGGWKYLLM